MNSGLRRAEILPRAGRAEGCPPTLEDMGAMREELHHLVDQVPEAELRPALELIRGFLEEHEEESERDLPFFASFEDEPDASEKYREILRSRSGF
ncbi:hypothetical protein GCM10027187_18760 [Streptosporangium sandarakinum]